MAVSVGAAAAGKPPAQQGREPIALGKLSGSSAWGLALFALIGYNWEQEVVCHAARLYSR